MRAVKNLALTVLAGREDRRKAILSWFLVKPCPRGRQTRSQEKVAFLHIGR